MVKIGDYELLDHFEKQLDAIHSIQEEVDSFVQRIKDKVAGLEDVVQKQLDSSSAASEMECEFTNAHPEGARARASTAEDMRGLSEPAALQEHREKKWSANAGWYWPLGTMSSLTQTTNFMVGGKELRLHNRWMQLSMQAEALLALSEQRRRVSASAGQKLSFHRRSLSNHSLSSSRMPATYHPLGKVRLIWDLVGLILLLADAILLPLSLAWDWQQGYEDAGSVFLLVVFMVSLVFWSLDIFMNLNTAFYERGALVFSRREILKHYMRTWFIIDLAVVVLDYITLADLVGQSQGNELGLVMRSMRVARAFRLVRLLKMARFDDLMQEIAASTGRQWIMLVVAIINSAVAILLVAHVMTCFWFFLGRIVLSDRQVSWLSLAFAQDLDPFTQYLHAFRYVMDAPSPPVIAEDSVTERFFDILTNIFCLVVIGSAISKISGTMVELRSMNEAKSKQRCEIRHYLHSQDASFELVSRVMKFVDYKLDKMMPTTFDNGLISSTLQTELSVNQRARFIQTMPIFDLSLTLYPEVFSSICVVLKKVVCENQEEVFAAGGLSTCMYITVTGEYAHIEGFDGTGEQTLLTGVNCLEELSLYVDALALNSSLVAMTFSEMFTLDGDNLVSCLQNSPSCAAMFFEYAKEFTQAVKKRLVGRPESKSRPCWHGEAARRRKFTRTCILTRRTSLDNINLTCARQKLNSATTTEELGRMSASSLTFADVPDEEEVPCEPVRHDWAGLKWLIEEGWPESLEEKELPEQLQSCLPELDPKGGPHVIFEQPMERDRAESSCICTLALLFDRYDIFTHPQPPGAKLRPDQWQMLQRTIKWAQPTDDQVHAVLVLLAIRSLGKSNNVAKQVPLDERVPEKVVLHLIDNYTNVIPSVRELSEEGLRYAKSALHLHSIFNFAQMLQGYLASRAHSLAVPTSAPEDLVLIRLACLARVEDRTAYRQLQECWCSLGAVERLALTQHFLADGLEETAFVFEFLPDCVANAVRNQNIGLACLLEMLVCLLNMLQPAAPSMLANLKDARVILVNLSDMSEFIACVRNRFVFETCVSRCKVRVSGGRVQLEMTGSNWARVNEPNSDITSLAYSVKDVLQKQRNLETHLLRGSGARKPDTWRV
ncbi:unnamed protein product [Effrenium voratum]|nr:unnamed protein product [Effrenium voratum]